MNNNTCGTVPFWEGENTDIAFVFSCPGKEEEKTGRVVSGTTGRNLDILLETMCETSKDNSIFRSANRYHYRITNASNIIHYKEKDNRTEPTCSEICSRENIDRLTRELSGYKIIITFGDKANCAISLCGEQLTDAKIVSVQHLGMQSLNQIKNDEKNDPIINIGKLRTQGQINTQKRLRVVVSEIIKQLKL